MSETPSPSQSPDSDPDRYDPDGYDVEDDLEGHLENDADDDSLGVTLDATVTATDPECIDILHHGSIEILGRMPWSSNGTYLTTVESFRGRVQAIYKPESGERPLWDFPSGLWRREVAAYLVAAEIGWELVPPTVERDGPLGVGSLQCFVPSRFEEHYFTFRDEPGHRPWLELLCAFDLVTNNTDRKAGHVLLGNDGHLWAIDHGLSFHEDFKLRTVLWDYAGDPVGTHAIESLVAWIERGPGDALAALLSAAELDAMRDRANAVIAGGHFPHDPSGRRYPWPLV